MPQVLTGLGSRYRKKMVTPPVATYASGGISTIQIDRSFFHKKLCLRLSGAVTWTGTATSLLNEAPLQLISKLELVGDGRKVFLSLSGQQAYAMSRIMEGKAGELKPPSALTGSSIAFAASFILHMEAARTGLPMLSLLDPRDYETLELRITWAAPSAIINVAGGATVVVDSGATLEVQDITTAQGGDAIVFNRLLLSQTITVAAASTSLTQSVPRAGLLHGIMLSCLVDGQTSDSFLTSVSLRSDNAYLHADRLGWAALQRANAIDYQLDVSGASLSAPQTVGHAFIDLSEDGDINSLVNVNDLNVLDMVFDTTLPSGTTREIRALFVFLEPR